MVRKRVLTNLVEEGSFMLAGDGIDLNPRNSFSIMHYFLKQSYAEKYAKEVYGHVQRDVHLVKIVKFGANKI